VKRLPSAAVYWFQEGFDIRGDGAVRGELLSEAILLLSRLIGIQNGDV
jgi:hypothetical protein